MQMEHYEIEDLFGRRQRPKLEVTLSSKRTSGQSQLQEYVLFAKVTNVGRGMARFYKVTLEVPAAVLQHDKKQHDSGSKIYLHVATTLPLFAGDSCELSFSGGIQFHMCTSLIWDFEHRGWPNLILETFADGAQHERSEVPFKGLQEF